MNPLAVSRTPVAIRTLLGITGLCLLFYGYKLAQLRELAFSFLPWNIFLAWIPLGLALLLVRLLKRRAWSDWPMLLLTLLWLLFLPNSFYLVSDYIHLREVPQASALYDAVMFTLFVFTGLCLGYSSLYLIHQELGKRLSAWRTNWVIAGILLLCSYAIYIGRDLRWNSWDVLASPAGLLFDLSNHLLQPSSWSDMLSTIAIFFALLGGMYLVAQNARRRNVRPRQVALQPQGADQPDL